MKIHPVGVEFFHAESRTDGQTERRTDMTKPIVTYRSFEDTSKI